MPTHQRFQGGQAPLAGILGGAKDAIDAVTGEPSAAGDGQKFRRLLKPLHLTDDATADTVSLTSDDYNVVGEFIVPPQERYRWGWGSAEHERNQGYAFIDARDGVPANLDGSIRLEQRDHHSRVTKVVFEEDMEPLRASKTDRTIMVPLPEQMDYDKVGHNSKLILTAQLDSGTGTFDWSNSDVLIPTAVYPTRNTQG